MQFCRSFHPIIVDGHDVQLRVFLPSGEGCPSKKPAVIMVCGLLWLGQGVLGRIGLNFNDEFGRAFARSGLPCVQIHTPCRHLANTRLPEMLLIPLWALSLVPFLNTAMLLGTVLMLAVTLVDFGLIALVPLLHPLGHFAVPVCHGIVRLAQWLQGTLTESVYRNHQKEIAAAVEWVTKNQVLLGSDDRLILCGYSSGANCAALYGLSDAAPRFEAVVLISGLYNVRTHTWTGCRRFLAPVFNLIFGDILNLRSDEDRDAASPDFMVRKNLEGQDWYILTAKMELMGLQPFEDILFQAAPMCAALTAKAGRVHSVSCGLNHWLLVFSAEGFINPFCKKFYC